MYTLNGLITFALYVGAIVAVITIFTAIYLKDKK